MIKNWVSHLFFLEKGGYSYTWQRRKGAIGHAHPYYVIYPRYGFSRTIVDQLGVEMCYEICMFTPLYLYMLTIYYVGRGRYNVVITSAVLCNKICFN